MDTKRLTILKVKGIDPDRISAIHAEVDRLNDAVGSLEGFLLAHDALKALKERLKAECVAYYEDWKTAELERLKPENNLGDAQLYSNPVMRAERAESRLKRAGVISTFKSEPRVALEGGRDWPKQGAYQQSRIARVLKCALGDAEHGDCYGIEVSITSGFEFRIRASYTFPPELDGKKDIQDIVDGREASFEFIPGDYLYGRLFELLGIKPTAGEFDLSKMLLPKK